MRTFFTRTPGAKFFSGTKTTIHVMPDYVEYIIKLDHGYYGVINLMAEGVERCSLLCYWGRYFDSLHMIPNKDRVMGILAKSCPELVKILSNQSEVKYAYFQNAKHDGGGFVMQLGVDLSKGIIPVLGNEHLHEKAIKLLNTSLKVFWEIIAL
ncbi:MAG: hypothetical protein Q4F34_00855 [Prevotellaceae bacterium]|nr:hypothetical protein [Prevotellaceae bacterium]